MNLFQITIAKSHEQGKPLFALGNLAETGHIHLFTEQKTRIQSAGGWAGFPKGQERPFGHGGVSGRQQERSSLNGRIKQAGTVHG